MSLSIQISIAVGLTKSSMGGKGDSDGFEEVNGKDLYIRTTLIKVHIRIILVLYLILPGNICPTNNNASDCFTLVHFPEFDNWKPS